MDVSTKWGTVHCENRPSSMEGGAPFNGNAEILPSAWKTDTLRGFLRERIPLSRSRRKGRCLGGKTRAAGEAVSGGFPPRKKARNEI